LADRLAVERDFTDVDFFAEIVVLVFLTLLVALGV